MKHLRLLPFLFLLLVLSPCMYAQSGDKSIDLSASDFVQYAMNDFLGFETWSSAINDNVLKNKGFVYRNGKWVNPETSVTVKYHEDEEDEMNNHIIVTFLKSSDARNFFSTFGKIGLFDKDYNGIPMKDKYTTGYQDYDFEVRLDGNCVHIGIYY